VKEWYEVTIVRGKVIGVSDYSEFKVGNVPKADYCQITLKCDNGELIQVSVSTSTMLNKTYMINGKNGALVQVGMIRPKMGDLLEVDGSVYPSYDEFHAKEVKYVKRITRSTVVRIIRHMGTSRRPN